MILQSETKIRIGKLGMIFGVNMSDNQLIDLFENAKPDETQKPFLKNGYHKVLRNGIIYIIEGGSVYKVLPLVKNDSTFTWINRNQRNGNVLWSTVDVGKFHFNLTAYGNEDNHVRISLVYGTCKEVTTSHIYEAGNEECLREMEIMLRKVYEDSIECLSKLSVDKAFFICNTVLN